MENKDYFREQIGAAIAEQQKDIIALGLRKSLLGATGTTLTIKLGETLRLDAKTSKALAIHLMNKVGLRSHQA